MSVHVIYYKDGAKFMKPVLTREEYLQLRGSARQKATLKAVREGDEQQKRSLLQMNYSCLPGEDGALRGATRLSTTVGMDVDHIAPEEMTAVRDRILEKKDELGLLMLERSARAAGYHLVFRRRAELSQEENLQWASDLLGVAFDAGAKDITRVFFTTTADEEELIYLNDEVFTIGEAEAESEERRVKSEESKEVKSEENCQLSIINYQLEYNGIPYNDIVRKYWELFNGGKEPSDGDRNVLTFELAVTLRSICDYSLEKLMQVVPNYWHSDEAAEEWRKTLENALKEPRKGMPYRLKQVLSALKSQSGVKACGGTLTAPPAMPKKLPPLVRLLTKNVPDFYKPAVASAVFPALGAHLHGVKFRYWDNVDHEATFMNVLIGRQSIGKGSIKKPVEYIMADIKQRDQPNRQREAEWKQKNPGAKQKKDPRPTDICIQMLIDNLTDAVFNQRVIDAHNNGQRFIYTIVDEIEALKKVTSKGTTDEVGLLIRDGTVSRLDLSTIIRADDEEDSAPVLGIYDHTFAQELKPYIERLEAANGLIECAQAKRLALAIKQENSEAAQLYESEAYRVRLAQGHGALRGARRQVEQGDRGLRALDGAIQPLVQDALLRPAAGEGAARGGGDSAAVRSPQPVGTAARRVHQGAIPAGAPAAGQSGRWRRHAARVAESRLHRLRRGVGTLCEDARIQAEIHLRLRSVTVLQCYS